VAHSGAVTEPVDRAEAAGDFAAALKAAPTPAWRAYLAARLGALESVGEVAASEAEAALVHLARGWVAAAGGELATALLSFDDASASQVPPRLRIRGLLAGAQVRLERGGPGDLDAALEGLGEAEALIDAEGADDLRLAWRLQQVRARAAGDDLGEALALAEALAAEAEGIHPEVQWQAEALLGELHSRRGSDFAARRHEQRSMEILEEIVVALPAALRSAFWSDPRRRAVRTRASSTTQRSVAAGASSGELLDRRTRRLLDILKRLACERDLDRLLERITDAAVELSEAERGFVLVPDAEGALVPRLVRGTPFDDPSVQFSRSIAEAVLIDGEPIVTVDAQDDRRLTEFLTVHKLRLKSVACLPIRGPAGTLGVIYLEHRLRRGRFADEDELELLLAFADQAAIALENARLVAELEARSAELLAANEELERAKDEIERVLAARTAQLEETKRDLDRTRNELLGKFSRGGIIGRSEAMRRVFAVLERVQETDVPVVIHGESGTGKELVARAIHYGGPRASKPFLAVNCAAIPEALLESELFGHVRGAFTGADKRRRGLLERASGGTLFLDEIGDMPPKMQVDLLRVLQDGRVRPVGAEEERTVDVRVVAASNKSLRDLVARGEFREDLYYRLNVVEIVLPPLRDRVGDLPLLCEHFLERIAEEQGKPRKRLTREALARLSRATLPGNVRQLEHVLLNACVLVEGDLIGPDDLALGEEESASSSQGRPPSVALPVAVPPQSFDDFKQSEKQRILAALEAHDWNRARAARALGIPRRTFYRRLKEHGILR